MEEDEPIVDDFCMIGQSDVLGDFIGFVMNRPGPDNFDVFCHEYPVYDYSRVSDELESWRSFELWLWGTAAAGEGTSVVRVLWGPEVARGWVRHESQSPLVFHPMLKREVAAPPGNRSPRTAPPRSKQ